MRGIEAHAVVVLLPEDVAQGVREEPRLGHDAEASALERDRWPHRLTQRGPGVPGEFTRCCTARRKQHMGMRVRDAKGEHPACFSPSVEDAGSTAELRSAARKTAAVREAHRDVVADGGTIQVRPVDERDPTAKGDIGRMSPLGDGGGAGGDRIS